MLSGINVGPSLLGKLPGIGDGPVRSGAGRGAWGSFRRCDAYVICPQNHFASKFNRRSGVRRFSLPITPVRRESRRSSIVSVASSTCKDRLVGRRLSPSHPLLCAHPPVTRPPIRPGRLQPHCVVAAVCAWLGF